VTYDEHRACRVLRLDCWQICPIPPHGTCKS